MRSRDRHDLLESARVLVFGRLLLFQVHGGWTVHRTVAYDSQLGFKTIPHFAEGRLVPREQARSAGPQNFEPEDLHGRGHYGSIAVVTDTAESAESVFVHVSRAHHRVIAEEGRSAGLFVRARSSVFRLGSSRHTERNSYAAIAKGC